ncbi:MAG TPA: hypothetical protein VLI42_01985 [Chthoniobacterales bacterium]|jgi:hypothetical protein|nr:hypothetical protein [Chthoniobacterales bacterium]
MSNQPQPNHTPGTPKGEEMALTNREPGRDPDRKHYQSARDSTGIDAKNRNPIHPDMPNIPPA